MIPDLLTFCFRFARCAPEVSDGAGNEEGSRRGGHGCRARRWTIDGAADCAGAGPGAAELLTPADVARRLGVPEPDAVALIESGDLPAKKIGSSYRVKRSELDAYLNR